MRLQRVANDILSVVFAAVLAIGCGLGLNAPATAQDAAGIQAGAGVLGKVTGLILPRFASLKSSRVHVRTGPATTYPIAWVFRRQGMPVEVIDEVDNWRRIRDSEGVTGWIFGPLLSRRRTALVSPWSSAASSDASKAALRDAAAIMQVPGRGAGAGAGGDTAQTNGEGQRPGPTNVPLRGAASLSARVVAMVEPGLVTDVVSCNGNWCEVGVSGRTGWMAQERLWGVYPQEVIN
ncbi:MAG: SH3 domain-containing protein [Pseudomonadota bacterium]